MTARILNVTEAEYHRDPCDVPSLSASCAKTLVTETPYHAWLHHPRYGNVRREPTDAKDHGTLVHALVLGKGGDRLAVLDVADYTTKAARALRDDARDAGLTPVKLADYEDADAVARAIRAELLAAGIMLDGQSEVAVEWDEVGPFGPVRCRAMMDHVNVSRGLIWDLKMCRSAHPKACASHTWEYGLDIQATAYQSALRKLNPAIAGRESFQFLFAEELPEGSPRRALVTPARLDGTFRELGARRWEQAIQTWAKCQRNNSWPAYSINPPVQLEAPGWALSQLEAAE